MTQDAVSGTYVVVVYHKGGAAAWSAKKLGTIREVIEWTQDVLAEKWDQSWSKVEIVKEEDYRTAAEAQTGLGQKEADAIADFVLADAELRGDR